MNPRFERITRIPEGTILDYEIRDEHGEPVQCGLTREEGREIKRDCGGLLCKVEVVH